MGTRTVSTCGPSKAISIRIRSVSVITDELCQNPAGRLGVEERDLQPEEPGPGLRVDQAGALGAQAGELGRDVVDLEGDVVHARAALRDEPADRRVRAEWAQELDPARAGVKRRRLDALRLERLPILEAGAEESLVDEEGRVEVGDGDPDVVDPAHRHAAQATARGRATPVRGGRRRARSATRPSPTRSRRGGP